MPALTRTTAGPHRVAITHRDGWWWCSTGEDAHGPFATVREAYEWAQREFGAEVRIAAMAGVVEGKT